MAKDKIIESVNQYYSDKIKTHGATPQGVDWNGAESQELRFKNLLKIVLSPEEKFSILDYGCGYGAMFEYMRDYLHYADPLPLFDYCKRNISKYVVLQHDYPLYEFSLLIRKEVVP